MPHPSTMCAKMARTRKGRVAVSNDQRMIYERNARRKVIKSELASVLASELVVDWVARIGFYRRDDRNFTCSRRSMFKSMFFDILLPIITIRNQAKMVDHRGAIFLQESSVIWLPMSPVKS